MLKKSLLIAAALMALPATLAATDSIGVHYQAGLVLNAGSEQIAPHFITSQHRGIVTQQYSTLLQGKVNRDLELDKRLSWGAGAEVLAGYTSSADYQRYNVDLAAFEPQKQHPARVWLQQLYVTGKHRGVFLTVGKKHHGSPLVDEWLSSGDLVMSGNAPLPAGARAGFVDFQNVPFTRGWLQICGEVGYYRSDDSKWLEHHHNNYNNFITTGYWINYKYLHLRSNPNKPFMVTLGMQAACQFGGTQHRYAGGVEVETIKMQANAKAFFKALIPGSGGNASGDHYYEGNHLGSWDLRLDYRFNNGMRLAAYHQHPWEDGSGIGFKNGFDGLWGLEFHSNAPGLETVVVEYLDLTNHSGPLHFNRHDYTDDSRPDGSPVTGQATGADDYYNNYAYSGYHNRGLALGSPMVLSPLYHQDGYMRFLHNVMRGVHVAAAGHLAPQWAYCVKASWRKSWGNIFMPLPKAVSGTSWMGAVAYDPTPHWHTSLTLAVDRGDLPGKNFGALFTIAYRGAF